MKYKIIFKIQKENENILLNPPKTHEIIIESRINEIDLADDIKNAIKKVK